MISGGAQAGIAVATLGAGAVELLVARGAAAGGAMAVNQAASMGAGSAGGSGMTGNASLASAASGGQSSGEAGTGGASEGNAAMGPAARALPAASVAHPIRGSGLAGSGADFPKQGAHGFEARNCGGGRLEEGEIRKSAAFAAPVIVLAELFQGLLMRPNGVACAARCGVDLSLEIHRFRPCARVTTTRQERVF